MRTSLLNFSFEQKQFSKLVHVINKSDNYNFLS